MLGMIIEHHDVVRWRIEATFSEDYLSNLKRIMVIKWSYNQTNRRWHLTIIVGCNTRREDRTVYRHSGRTTYGRVCYLRSIPSYASWVKLWSDRCVICVVYTSATIVVTEVSNALKLSIFLPYIVRHSCLTSITDCLPNGCLCLGWLRLSSVATEHTFILVHAGRVRVTRLLSSDNRYDLALRDGDTMHGKYQPQCILNVKVFNTIRNANMKI